MKRSKVVSLLALLMAPLFVFSACVKKPAAEGEGNKGTEGGDKPASSKVLTIATPYTIATFEPWTSTSDGDRYVMSNVYEALIENDEGSKFIPGLAESWESVDDTTWRFHLRDNAYWQTGNDLFPSEKVQVTAEDVKAVYDFIMDEANGASKCAVTNQYVESVVVVDKTTLDFKTKGPTSMLEKTVSDILIFPVLAVEKNFDLSKMPVGSGAFKFAEYKTDDSITLVPNADFYIKPNVDKVIFKIIPDKATAAIALQNKEVDIVPQILNTDLETIAGRDFLQIVPNNTGWYRYLGFNTSVELFQDIKVRQAISMAIDFNGIVEAIFDNKSGAQLAIPAYGGAVPLEFEGADIETWKKHYVYDPEQAQKLLEEAGWSKNSNGIYEKNGKTLSFAIKSPTSDQNRMKFGDMAATSLKAIGIDCSSQPTEWATMTADIKAGNTEMFVMGGGSVIGGMNMLFNSVAAASGSHNTFYVDEELNKMLGEADATVDKAKRVELLKACSLRALENKVHAGGYFEYVQIAINKRVTDFAERPTLWYGLCNSTRNVGITE